MAALCSGHYIFVLWFLLLSSSPPFPQIDIIRVMVIVWRVRGKIIRSVLCSIVCISCAQCNAHTWTDLTWSLHVAKVPQVYFWKTLPNVQWFRKAKLVYNKQTGNWQCLLMLSGCVSLESCRRCRSSSLTVDSVTFSALSPAFHCRKVLLQLSRKTKTSTWWYNVVIPSVLWHCRLGHLIRRNPSPIWHIMCLAGR